MAGRDHKIVRRAQALTELGRLSESLAERFNIQPPHTQVTNKDPELAEIQRIEGINELLNRVLEAPQPIAVEAEKVRKPVKHGANT